MFYYVSRIEIESLKIITTQTDFDYDFIHDTLSPTMKIRDNFLLVCDILSNFYFQPIIFRSNVNFSRKTLNMQNIFVI